MRIGLIRMRHTPYGGAETFLQRFMDGLLRKGHEVEVFSTDWPLRPGVTVRRVHASGPRFLRPLSFARNVDDAVKGAGLDCVVSLERTYSQDVYRAGDGCHREWLIRKRAAETPLKNLLSRFTPLHGVLLGLEKRLFESKRLKLVVANSRMVKADIIRHYGLPEDKLCVIYNGIGPVEPDPQARERIRKAYGIDKETCLILFVGSGFERKGLIYAVRALSVLKKEGRDVRLLVVGKGRTSPYAKEAGRLGLSDSVIFTGPVAGALKYYQAGDVFVLPTIYEPFSNACLEALASGLPVITTEANGAAEIIRDSVTGAVVPDPADFRTLAARIAPFLDKDARKRAGRLAADDAKQYTIERTVDEFLAAIFKTAARA